MRLSISLFLDKNTLGLFNLNIGLRLFFIFNLLKYHYHYKSIFILVCWVKMLEFFCFLGDKPKTIIISLVHVI